MYIRFGSKLYRQIVGISMGTNCAPFVADLFLFYYESDFDSILFRLYGTMAEVEVWIMKHDNAPQ